MSGNELDFRDPSETRQIVFIANALTEPGSAKQFGHALGFYRVPSMARGRAVDGPSVRHGAGYNKATTVSGIRYGRI
jgi:hypothetical protein